VVTDRQSYVLWSDNILSVTPGGWPQAHIGNCPFVWSPFCRLSSTGSSVGIITGYGLNGKSSIPGRRRDISLFHKVHTGSGAHPASYPMGTAIAAGARKWPLISM
jgi:hypothetical protein